MFETPEQLIQLGQSVQGQRYMLSANFVSWSQLLRKRARENPQLGSKIQAMYLQNVGMIVSMERYLKNIAASLRLKFLREFADESNKVHYKANQLDSKITCKKGCSACCKIYVSTCKEEAVELAEEIKSGRVTIDEEKLKRLSHIKESKDWKTFEPCIFLDEEGSCKVYEKRPLACRNYAVISDPKICDPSVKQAHRVQVAVGLPGEVCISALYNVTEEIGSIPYMISKELNK